MSRPLIITPNEWGAFVARLRDSVPDLAPTDEGWEFLDWRGVVRRFRLFCEPALDTHVPKPAEILARFLRYYETAADVDRIVISGDLLDALGLPETEAGLLKSLRRYWPECPKFITIIQG